MYTGFVSAPKWVVDAIIKSLMTQNEVEIEDKQYAKEIVNIIKIKKPVVLTLDYPPAGITFTTIGTTIYRGDLGNYWTIEFGTPIQGLGVNIFSNGENYVRVTVLVV